MSFLKGPKVSPAPESVAPPPAVSTEIATNVGQGYKKKEAMRKGFLSTMLTGGRGVLTSSNSDKKTLLG